MKIFTWQGPSGTHLGRFGKVNRGDPLMLTEHEGQYVKADKNYRPLKDWPEQGATEHLTNLAQKDLMDRLELEQMTKGDLKNLCRHMGISVGPLASNQGMVLRVLEARRSAQAA